MTRIRVLLVDDHTVVRQGLRRILESDGDIDVVGEASSGRIAVRTVPQIRPDVVVMDLALPELNGVEATRQIVKQCEGIGVLILSMHADQTFVRESLHAGAKGFVLKDADPGDLLHGVKAVNRGESFFSPAVSRVMLDEYVDGGAQVSEADLKLTSLTDREREVLQLITEGKSSKEVASLMDVSIHTVDSHRKHLMEKLGVHNTAQLVRFAVQTRLVP
jgi:two-component system, NarL family, response regulator NreC